MLTAQEKLTFALIDRNIRSGEATMRNQSNDPPNGAAERLEKLYEVRAKFAETCGGRVPCGHCKGKGWKIVAYADQGADLTAGCPYCGGEGDVPVGEEND